MKCRLSDLMGRDKLKVSDVASATGLNRSTISALYKETAVRIELDAIEKICTLFNCEVSELFQIIPEELPSQNSQNQTKSSE